MKEINIENLVAEHTEDMYRWAFHKTSSNETAEDLVQDTFLVAAEKLSGFKGNSSPKTWLFSILNNKIIDFYRKKARTEKNIGNQSITALFDGDGNWKKNREPRDWGEDESHLLDNEDFQKILKQCLDALPQRWNTCVKLKYLSTKSGEEICQEVGISSSNFWQIIHRAKLQLRECIDENWFNH